MNLNPMRPMVPVLASIALAGCIAPVREEQTAWRRVVLVELFTSQGCSSCPAADDLVRELPRLGYPRDKVLPLTFHVSYWDGFGWNDPFSSPVFTARQQWYADSGKLRSPDAQVFAREIFTPQMVVDGTVHFSGARRPVALSQIQRAAAAAPDLRIGAMATVDGDAALVTVRASGGARPDPAWRLFLALAAKRARTQVGGGENAGRTLEEADVVRALSGPLPVPAGDVATSVARLTRPAALRWSELELVAFVQSMDSLAIAGATAVELPAGSSGQPTERRGLGPGAGPCQDARGP
jgi:hypothetical protein